MCGRNWSARAATTSPKQVPPAVRLSAVWQARACSHIYWSRSLRITFRCIVKLRRRVHAGLNKGEARNALARSVFFYRLGEIRDRSFEAQRYRASGLNLVTTAIVLWNTVYLERTVQTMHERGVPADTALLPYLTPAWLGAHQPDRRLRVVSGPQASGRQVQAAEAGAGGAASDPASLANCRRLNRLCRHTRRAPHRIISGYIRFDPREEKIRREQPDVPTAACRRRFCPSRRVS